MYGLSLKFYDIVYTVLHIWVLFLISLLQVYLKILFGSCP